MYPLNSGYHYLLSFLSSSTSLEDSNIAVSPLAVLNRPHTARSPLVPEKEDSINRPTTVGNKGSRKTKTKQVK